MPEIKPGGQRIEKWAGEPLESETDQANIDRTHPPQQPEKKKEPPIKRPDQLESEQEIVKKVRGETIPDFLDNFVDPEKIRDGSVKANMSAAEAAEYEKGLRQALEKRNQNNG